MTGNTVLLNMHDVFVCDAEYNRFGPQTVCVSHPATSLRWARRLRWMMDAAVDAAYSTAPLNYGLLSCVSFLFFL